MQENIKRDLAQLKTAKQLPGYKQLRVQELRMMALYLGVVLVVYFLFGTKAMSVFAIFGTAPFYAFWLRGRTEFYKSHAETKELGTEYEQLQKREEKQRKLVPIIVIIWIIASVILAVLYWFQLSKIFSFFK